MPPIKLEDSQMAPPSSFLSTADVPPQFLKAVMMVGVIPFTALQSDPRISYTLYVPAEHYNPAPKHDDSDSSPPPYDRPRLPLVVSVHGSGRNAEQCRDLWMAFADAERVAVLAPFFPAGIEGPTDLDSYKLLKTKSLRSDRALLDILDEVVSKWPGLDTAKVFLTGFSGGGQFVHRFAYLYPERLYAISVGAPGRVTLLAQQKWPNGVGNVQEIFGKGVGKLGMEVQFVVGELDNAVHGTAAFWEWLVSRGLAEEAMTTGRIDTLRELQASWTAAGVASTLDVVPGFAHNFKGVRPQMEEFLRPLVRRVHEGLTAAES